MSEPASENYWLDWLFAAGVLIGFGVLSFATGTMTGWSQEPVGSARVADSLPGLALSLVLGILAIGGCRALLGRHPVSPWLLLAVPVPFVFLLEAAGSF